MTFMSAARVTPITLPGAPSSRPRLEMVLIAGVLLVLLTAAGAVLGNRTYRQARQEVITRAEFAAGTAALETNAYLSASITMLDVLAATPAVRTGDPEQIRQHVLDASAIAPELGGVIWSDSAGVVQVRTGASLLDASVSRPQAEAIARVMAGRRPAVGPIFGSAAAGGPFVFIAVPVFGEQGQANGVLAGMLTLSTLQERLVGFRPAAAGVVGIVDAGGRGLADNSDAPAPVTAGSVFGRGRGDSRGVFENTAGLQGEPGRLLAYASVPTGDWLVVTEQPSGDAFAPARASFITSLTALVAVALAGMAGVIAMDRRGRDEREQRLTHQAFHDGLTGLPNRMLFMDRLAHALTSLRRRNGRVAVLFLDLDGFKAINDSMGHATGDAMLSAVSERLVATFRINDTVSRYGGDEFAVLVEDVAHDADILRLAERCVDRVSRPLQIHGRSVTVNASIGVAICDPSRGFLSAGELVREADDALYQAKAAGKGRVMLFEPDAAADPDGGAGCS